MIFGRNEFEFNDSIQKGSKTTESGINGIEFNNSETKESKTRISDIIKLCANILFVIHIIGGLSLCAFFTDKYYLDDFAWFPIMVAINYCVLLHPIIIGFSVIVAAAEKINDNNIKE